MFWLLKITLHSYHLKYLGLLSTAFVKKVFKSVPSNMDSFTFLGDVIGLFNANFDHARLTC